MSSQEYHSCKAGTIAQRPRQSQSDHSRSFPPSRSLPGCCAPPATGSSAWRSRPASCHLPPDPHFPIAPSLRPSPSLQHSQRHPCPLVTTRRSARLVRPRDLSPSMGSNPSRPRPPCPPPPADGASTSSARATFSTAAGDGLMHVDEAGAIGSHRQLAGQRRARAVSSATTVAGAGGRPSFGSSSSSSTPGVPGSPSHAGSSTFGSLFSRRTSPPTNAGDTSPRRKDPKRRRLSGLLSPRGGASGSGAGSGWSSMAASTTKRDKGKEREGPSQPPPLPRSPGVLDGEPTSRVVNAASTARPGSCVGLLEPVMSSSTEPIVRPTSLSRRPSIGMLGDDIDDVEDGTDPLASPRRRAAQLIERVSMESLRTGLGTAAYVNPLPDVLAPVGTASSGPDPAPEQVHAEATRASDLLSSVLHGYPSPLQRPPTPAVTTGSSPSPPSPSTGQPPTSAPTNRHTHTRGGGTSMVVGSSLACASSYQVKSADLPFRP